MNWFDKARKSHQRQASLDEELQELFAGDSELLAVVDAIQEGLAQTRAGRWRRDVAIAIVAAVLIAPAAVAFGGRIRDLFEGTPATQAVEQNYIVFNGSLTESIRKRFSVEPVEINKAHGVIALETRGGLLYLWSAPEQQGGACFFVQYAHPIAPDTARSGAEGCDPAIAPNPRNILANDYWTATRPSVRILYGYTYAHADSVDVVLTNGSTLRLRVTERYFVGALDANERISRIVARNVRGREVGETPFNIVDASSQANE